MSNLYYYLPNREAAITLSVKVYEHTKDAPFPPLAGSKRLKYATIMVADILYVTTEGISVSNNIKIVCKGGHEYYRQSPLKAFTKFLSQTLVQINDHVSINIHHLSEYDGSYIKVDSALPPMHVKATFKSHFEQVKQARYQ